jgi:multiple sugar transport system permease protein
VGPIAAVFWVSFMHYPALGATGWGGLDNYRTEFADPAFWNAMEHTAIYAAVGVPLSVVLSLLIALAIHNRSHGGIYRVIYFLPGITSPVAVAVVWAYLFNLDFGPVNAVLRVVAGIEGPDWLGDSGLVMVTIALVAVWQGLGYSIIIMLAGLSSIPSTYLDAARVDGAGRWRMLRSVIVPLLSPTIFFVSIVTVIGALQVFDLVYVLTRGGPGDRSTTMVHRIYTLAFQYEFDFGRSAVVAVVLFLLTLVLTVIGLATQRRWVHYDA